MKKCRSWILVLVAVLVSLAMVSCGGKKEESAAAPQSDKLTVWQFRGCNLEDPIKEWGEANNVEIELQVIDRDTMMNNLMTVLASGSGVPDVVTIGGPFIEKFKANPQHFVNLIDKGNFEEIYLPWRLDQLKTKDGKYLVGLPTDIGPIALAYRRDIFEAAGLPSEPDELQEILQNKEDYREIGKIIKEKTGKALVPNIETVMQCLLGQDYRYFWNEKGELIMDKSEPVLDVWDYCISLHELGLSAAVKDNSSEWGAGLNNGDFATQLIPAWKAGGIKGNAPDTAGKWGVIRMDGTGNWGGSMISVPAKSKNPEKAVELVKFLMSPETQLRVYQEHGNFPTTVANYSNPALTEYVDPFFGNSEFGRIFSEAAANIKGAYLGPDYETVVKTLIDGMSRIELGEETPEESFKHSVEEANRQLSR